MKTNGDPPVREIPHLSYEERAERRQKALAQPQSARLTGDEAKCLELTTELWNAFMALPLQHPSDAGEFCVALHQLQHIIMIRSVRRMHPDIFYAEENPNGKPMVDPSKEYRP